MSTIQTNQPLSRDSRPTSNVLLFGLFALFILTSFSAEVRADEVTHWNEIATSTFGADASINSNPLAESRIYAMTHIAIHDALNAIDRRYHPYVFNGQTYGEISPEAAVTEAAYRVLIHELPNQQGVLDAAHAAALGNIPDGDPKTRGILLGQATAAAIIDLRSVDGSTSQVPYTPGTQPGDWQPTPGPPDFLPAFQPGWGSVTPFALKSGDQFRPAPSAYFNLTSGAYTRNYKEVKSIGSINSTTRTVDQSEIAMFWYANSPGVWNRIARNVTAGKDLDLWQNARLFGLLNLALADGYISSWDAKYFYNFWRPVTAIRAGDQDGNPRTIADTGWTPFLFTPPVPDNSSGHSVAGADAAEVLARFFRNDHIAFTTTSDAPFAGITRSFSSFSQAAHENADSRVFAGIHFRAATEDGLEQGKKVGRYVFTNFLRPSREGRHEKE